MCKANDIEFFGYDSYPLPRLSSLSGVKGIAHMIRLSGLVKKDLKAQHVDLAFSFGGYASAPVTSAVNSLGLPLIVHEQNSVPGRSNLLASRGAFAVATVFESAEKFFGGRRVVRTGMPIRRELGVGEQGVLPFNQQIDTGRPTLLVMGGSQGSSALNDIALATAQRLDDRRVQWVHSTGVEHYEATMRSLQKLPVKGSYVIRSFLEAKDLGAVLHNSTLAISRSGCGAISEFAAFRKPAIYIPLPTSYKDHQTLNALEIEGIGGGSVIPQKELQSRVLADTIIEWLEDSERYCEAQKALAKWDRPDAANLILELGLEAAGR